MQYQVAQGGNHGYSVGIPDDELADLLARDNWQETVNHDGLVIHRLHGFLIWYFLEANGQAQNNLVYFSSLIDPPDAMRRRYGLEEL